MGNSFIGKVELYNGAIQACKVCQKTGTIGDPIYIQNIGDEANKNWIRCVDLECFEKQGGTKPDANKKWTGKKQRTVEERLLEVKTVGPILWKMADEFITETYQDLAPTEFSIKQAVAFKEFSRIFCRD